MDATTAIVAIQTYVKLREDGFQFDAEGEMVDALLDAAVSLADDYVNLLKAYDHLQWIRMVGRINSHDV